MSTPSTVHPFFCSDQCDSAQSQGWLRHSPLAFAALSPRNHHQTFFICPGTECAAVITDPQSTCMPGQLSIQSRVNTDGISFECSPLVMFHLDDDNSQEYSLLLLIAFLATSCILYSLSLYASRQSPRVKPIMPPVVAPCPCFNT